MDTKNEVYLLILSILFGISVLKLTEIFQFADEIKGVIFGHPAQGLSVITVGVFAFIAGYILFFLLATIASLAIVGQLINGSQTTYKKARDIGPIIGMCVAALTISYMLVFAVAIYDITGIAKL